MNRRSPPQPKRTVGSMWPQTATPPKTTPPATTPKPEPRPEGLSPNLPIWRHLLDLGKKKIEAWISGRPVFEVEPPTVPRGLYLHESGIYLVLGTGYDKIARVGQNMAEERLPLVIYVSLSDGRIYARDLRSFSCITTWPDGFPRSRFIHRDIFTNNPLAMPGPLKHQIDIGYNLDILDPGFKFYGPGYILGSAEGILRHFIQEAGAMYPRSKIDSKWFGHKSCVVTVTTGSLGVIVKFQIMESTIDVEIHGAPFDCGNAIAETIDTIDAEIKKRFKERLLEIKEQDKDHSR